MEPDGTEYIYNYRYLRPRPKNLLFWPLVPADLHPDHPHRKLAAVDIIGPPDVGFPEVLHIHGFRLGPMAQKLDMLPEGLNEIVRVDRSPIYMPTPRLIEDLAKALHLPYLPLKWRSVLWHDGNRYPDGVLSPEFQPIRVQQKIELQELQEYKQKVEHERFIWHWAEKAIYEYGPEHGYESARTFIERTVYREDETTQMAIYEWANTVWRYGHQSAAGHAARARAYQIRDERARALECQTPACQGAGASSARGVDGRGCREAVAVPYQINPTKP